MATKRAFKGCKKCPFGKLGRCTSGGNLNSKFVILGQSPGKHEVEEERPFVGLSGKLVQGILCENGIRLDDCYLVNAMNCQPHKNLGSSKVKEEEMKKAVGLCRERVMDEIFSKERKVILALGEWAYYALFKESVKITEKRGKVRPKRKCPVVPTVHPSSILRNGKQFDDFLKDIKEAADLFKKGCNPPYPCCRKM